MLEIRNLHARVEGKEILHGINLNVYPGEIHAIMGPNGSGKSTLAKVLAGQDGYAVSEGQVLYKGKDLLGMLPEDRARMAPQLILGQRIDAVLALLFATLLWVVIVDMLRVSLRFVRGRPVLPLAEARYTVTRLEATIAVSSSAHS